MMPIKLLIKCAPNTALGWAAGTVVRTNRKSVVPPSEANSNGEFALVTHQARLIATVDPKRTHSKRRNTIFTRPDLLR